jgi:molybdopterin converting factor small subunit
MKVLYFAHLKDITCTDSETLNLNNISQVMIHLKNKYPKLSLDNCLLSLNANIIPKDHNGILSDADELVFIPPVSGG